MAAKRRCVPDPEVERRSFLHFAPHQDGLEFTKAELKNRVYAWYFTEISVRKKEYRIAQFWQWTQNADKLLIRILPVIAYFTSWLILSTVTRNAVRDG